MDIKTILENFYKDKTISEVEINTIKNDNKLRIELANYFRQNKDRDFALCLLDTFISIRQQPNGEMPAENLMLACYILGLHNQVEDCLKIWEAKNADFDTYCGLDIQLVPFAGVKETIEFLKGQTTIEGEKAFNYVSECSKCGDFDSLEEYFSKDALPWFI
ncbi:MAG: hypothetical protein ABI861_03510 [Panacibacter sp.]